MNKETRAFIWGIIQLIIGCFCAVITGHEIKDEFNWISLGLLVCGIISTIIGYMKIEKNT